MPITKTEAPQVQPPARSKSPLTNDMLIQFESRSRQHDQQNTFFAKDFEELRDAGYLRLAVPAELGGLGLSLADVVREQRRLAYYAAPTALAINMHLYWTGIAADLWRAGDTSLTWLLKEAARDHVFAAGHAESGNDIPILLSTTKAERVEGGYRFTGRKSFGSLTPVWNVSGYPWHGYQRPRAAEDRPCVHAAGRSRQTRTTFTDTRLRRLCFLRLFVVPVPEFAAPVENRRLEEQELLRSLAEVA